MKERRKRNLARCAAIALLLAAAPCSLSQGATAEEAVALHDRALQFYREGRYKEATPLAERAVEVREKELGLQDADTATALETLSKIYRANGTYALAEPVCKRMLVIREKIFGLENPD